MESMKKSAYLSVSIFNTENYTKAHEVGYGNDIHRAFRDSKIPNAPWYLNGSCSLSKLN